MSPNVYWYLMLLVFSLILGITICLKKRELKNIFLFLIMVELAYLFETVISVFFKSYEYFPHIIKYNTYYDNNIGALISNLVAVPITAIFIAIFKLKLRWKILFVLFFAGIESLFLSLGIYIHHWWRIEYTSVGLFIYFWLADKIHLKLLKPLNGPWRFIFLFLTIAPLQGTVHILPIMLFCNRVYSIGWFGDPGHNTTAFASLYYLAISLIQVVIIMLNLKKRFFKYLLLAFLVLLSNEILRTVGILNSRTWWDLWLHVLLPVIVLRFGESVNTKLTF